MVRQLDELVAATETTPEPEAVCGQSPAPADLRICPIRLQEAAALLERGSDEQRALAGELLDLAKRLQGHTPG